ncbi:hypothetical protein [Brevundimonas sp. AJA228-03]|uniref:hypothetical protein n=1 Tax=Brevundimonas sp. AJA228-03 TaxID=2752515 RepID=UPI001FD7C656|nr:hypothetical protein [Brevundimonas sp. AJA228-03]
MRKTFVVLLVTGLAVSAAACTDARRARNAATFGDKPADITCWTYGTETFAGRSTGKVEYNDGGRIAFVDAANGRYTTIDGECRVVYLADGDEAAKAAVAPGEAGGPVAPPPAVPEA